MIIQHNNTVTSEMQFSHSYRSVNAERVSLKRRTFGDCLVQAFNVHGSVIHQCVPHRIHNLHWPQPHSGGKEGQSLRLHLPVERPFERSDPL